MSTQTSSVPSKSSYLGEPNKMGGMDEKGVYSYLIAKISQDPRLYKFSEALPHVTMTGDGRLTVSFTHPDIGTVYSSYNSFNQSFSYSQEAGPGTYFTNKKATSIYEYLDELINMMGDNSANLNMQTYEKSDKEKVGGLKISENSEALDENPEFSVGDLVMFGYDFYFVQAIKGDKVDLYNDLSDIEVESKYVYRIEL